MGYLLVFLMNVNNFEPVIVKNCSQIQVSSSKVESERELKKLAGMSLACEQIEDKISYACLSANKEIVARVIVLKDLKECKEFPNKISSDMRKLMNVR